MTPPEHPFRKLNQHSVGRARDTIENAWEEDRVQYLIRVLHLGSKWAAKLRERQELRSSEPRLTFSSFCSEFENFPLLLTSATMEPNKLHRDPTAFLPAMFLNFRGTPFFKRYEELFDMLAPVAQRTGRAVGLVFKRQGFRQGMCLFNDAWEVPDAFHGLCAVYRCTTRGHRLYLTAFDGLVEAIYAKGHGWRPE